MHIFTGSQTVSVFELRTPSRRSTCHFRLVPTVLVQFKHITTITTPKASHSAAALPHNFKINLCNRRLPSLAARLKCPSGIFRGLDVFLRQLLQSYSNTLVISYSPANFSSVKSYNGYLLVRTGSKLIALWGSNFGSRQTSLRGYVGSTLIGTSIYLKHSAGSVYIWNICQCNSNAVHVYT